jgi:hypothetical protein
VLDLPDVAVVEMRDTVVAATFSDMSCRRVGSVGESDRCRKILLGFECAETSGECGVDGVVGVGTERQAQGRVRVAGGVVDGGGELGRVAGEDAVVSGLQVTPRPADGVVTVGGRFGGVAQGRGEAGAGGAGLDQGEVPFRRPVGMRVVPASWTSRVSMCLASDLASAKSQPDRGDSDRAVDVQAGLS